MKFYRTLQPFKVMSFDLDDTLYDNSEVIRLAEQHCVDFLRHLSEIKGLNLDYWRSWKQQIEQQDPMLCEDVTAWRMKTIRAMLQFHGKSAVEIESILQDTMEHFLEWRHKITVPPQSVNLLERLKSRYKLTALTNGNVDPKRIGLSHFELVLTGGKHGRAKPHQDLFRQAAAYFNVQPQEILHVGDNLITDVQGAIEAGCQAVWLNLSNNSFEQSAAADIAPTIEIRDLSQLVTL